MQPQISSRYRRRRSFIMLSSPSLLRIRRSLVSSRSSSTDLFCKSLSCSLSSSSAIALESPLQSILLQHSHIIPKQSSYLINNGSNNTAGIIQTRYIHSQQQCLATPKLLLQTINYDTQSCLSIRQFATKSSDNTDTGDDTKTEKKKDLRESIERLKKESSDSSSSDESDSSGKEESESNPHIEKFTQLSTSFFNQISLTWDELISSGQATDINKKIGTPNSSTNSDEPNYANDDEAADKYEEYKGSKNIMVIDNAEELSAWERMERRLRDAPIISDILDKSEQVYKESGTQQRVQQTQQKIQHLKEDAEEAWETSQNPWIYRASSVYDTITAESEFATATKQLQILDPEFTLESWKHNVVEYTLPNIMNLFLQGRINELKPMLGEAVYNRLAAEVRARKKEGVQMDTNVLAIMNAEILACEVDGVNVEKGDDPIILVHFMCQQIHCVRKKKKKSEGSESDEKEDVDGGNKEEEKKDEDATKEEESEEEENSNRTFMDEELGEIVEGSEDDIRANSYVVAFQREYNEEKMELNWKIVDFRFNGAIAYL